MLTALALVPSPPLLVPELAAAAAADTDDLRNAAISAAAALPSRWIAVGVSDADGVYGSATRGTFAGYGRDIRVGLSPDADAPDVDAPDAHAIEPSPLPLCALVTGWLRGAARPDASSEVHAVRADLDADAALARGAALRQAIDTSDAKVGVLVVADGAHTLTPAAPGGHDPDSVHIQAALDDALAGGDTAALAALPAGIVGRVAYQVLAGLCGTGPRSTTELYRGAPFGVGYFVGVWTP